MTRDSLTITPIRKQYLQLKARHPDAILFFRLGDFYETFDGDAEIAARELDLVLTSRPVARDVRVPMAGVPHHAVEGYIARLIEKGYRVAIAEQVGEVTGRGLVDREVTRVVTPGTVVEPTLLDARRPSYLAALVVEEGRAGLAYTDITTGEFAAAQLARDEVARELARLQPRECLIPKSAESLAAEVPNGAHVTPLPDYRFEVGAAEQALLDHFQVATLEGFGCAGKPLAVRAAGAILHYLRETQKGALAQLATLRTYSTERFLALDPATRRNLELTETLRERKVHGSLLGVLDQTMTPMGGRLMRLRLTQPLVDRAAIEARLDEVEAFYQDAVLRGRVRAALKDMPDLERLANRVLSGIAGPRDLLGIRRALEAVRALQEGLGQASGALAGLAQALDPCPELADLIARAIVDEPPASASAGGVIRAGFSEELDGLLRSVREAREWLASLERREQRRTGIKNLKVGYNKVFGYYIEVTKANLSAVPADYIRKQTLVNAERFITPELKEVETLILNAEERQAEVEMRLFGEIVQHVAARGQRLLETARTAARLDVAAALAEVAVRNRYVRPVLSDDEVLDIVGGRHPVVEQTLRDEPFVPNDLHLDDQARILLITGPNMAGKCLKADTLVFTQKGLVPIGSLRPEGAAPNTFSPLQIGVAGPSGDSLASHFYDGGAVAVLRVHTRLGFELTGTPDHRLWARRPDGSEGWVRLEELTPEDYVALKPGTHTWGESLALDVSPMHVRSAIQYRYPDHLSPDFAYFIGLLIGDGSLSHPMRVSMTTADLFLGEEFCRIAKEIFGYEPFVVRKKGTIALSYVITSADIRLYLQQIGLGLVCSHEKTVPPVILQAPAEIVVAFLQGLFDTDGYADRRYGNIEFSTASPRLAQQVQLLLLNLGIVSSLHLKKTQRRLAYRLSVRGEDAIRFYERVGFRLPRKQERRALCSTLRMPNVGSVPYLEQTLRVIQKRIADTENKPQALKKARRINSVFYTYIPNRRNVSYQKLTELVEYCHQNGVPCPELEWLLANRYLYDRVVAVEPAGEHPVCDLSVPEGHAYVAAGFVSHNSVYLRQNAIIVLMAQMGSFVPAERAQIGLVDRIFTRIGAQDEVAAGQSTFMVEMVETANILNNATPRSLLILDEIGRGTSTYDGISIAWAVVEYLHNHPQRRARTLFATHYHELTELAERLPSVRNANLAVAEEEGQVIFLHRVVPGSADRSYGIHVAQLAGVPRPVIHRAEELLEGLESGSFRPGTAAPTPYQPLLFAAEHPVVSELKKMDVSTMTPLEAINKLYELQKKSRE